MTGEQAYEHCLGDPLNRAVLDRNDMAHFLVTKAWGPGLTQPATLAPAKAFAEHLAPYTPIPKNKGLIFPKVKSVR